jgi:iron complex outermembrane receptor protein
MMKGKLITTAIFCALVATSAAETQTYWEATNTQEIVEEFEGKLVPNSKLKTSVIEGSKEEKEVKELTKNTYVITKEDIETSGASNIIDVLKKAPGIFTGSGYTDSGIVDFRGQGEASKNNVLVLVDGIRQNPIDMSGVDFRNIDINTIERIEVIPSGGIIYGDNAIGGVINIITDKCVNQITLGSGTYGYTNYGGSLVEDYGDTKLYASFYKSENEGYRAFSTSDKESFSIGSKYKINDYNSLNIEYNVFEGNYQFPGYLTKDQVEENRRQSLESQGEGLSSNEIETYSANYTFNKGNLEITNNLSYKTNDNDYMYYNSWTSAWPDEFSNKKSELTSNSLKAKYIYGKNTVLTGMDINKGNTESDNANKVEKNQLGLFIHDTYKLNDKFSFNAGYRNEKVDLDYSSGRSKTYKEDLFGAGASYFYSDKGSTYISFEQNYRTPTTDEYFDSWSNTYNENLKPQISEVLEIGLREYIWNTAFNFAIFQNTSKDEIYYNSNTWANENYSDKIIREGLELSATSYIGDFTISQSYSYISAEFDGGAYNGKTVPWVPENRYSIKSDYKVSEFTNVALEYIYVDEVYSISDMDNSMKKVSDYSLVNLSGNYQIDNINLYAGVNNILDEKYYEYVTYGSSYYPAKERYYYIGINYKF